MAKNPAQQLIEFGTSVWYDNISRELLNNGELKRLIEEWGVRGLTSNPTIFDQAISKSSIYDSAIAGLRTRDLSIDQIFEELAIEDIGRAADLLRPVFDSSSGDDGFVSIEVSPLLASNTKGTIDEAVRLHRRLSRPNVMIKVPGTKEGIPAVRALLEQGIHVNITLLFSVANYREVAQTYIDALAARNQRGEDVSKIRSVASFFVSRVDSIIDKRLGDIVKANESKNPALAEQANGLMGRFAIANSKLAYAEFGKLFSGAKWEALRQAGAVAQRPLWASTSTKNPAFRDVIYVEELIGPETVNTMPHNTLEAFVDHGKLAKTVTNGLAEAIALEKQLNEVGVNVDDALRVLQEEGVEKFADSFKSLNATLSKKLNG